MANEQQFKVRTNFVATRTADDYRASVSEWVTERDSVLEIGCTTGGVSELLALRAAEVVATDTSKDAIEQARLLHPDVRFEVLDAADTRSALQLGTHFDKIYFDVTAFSGYRSLLDLLALTIAYATLFTPAVIVMKSATLAQFADRCVVWRSPVGTTPRAKHVRPNRGAPPTHTTQHDRAAGH